MSLKEKTSSPTSLISQINSDYLTCQICIDTYRQPKVLKCQHTFCKECLESCERSDSGSYISCPVCREKTLLGLKGVASLKDNFAFSSMIYMIDSQKKSKVSGDHMPVSQGKTVCTTCPDENKATATYQCLDCLDEFCANCAAFHRRTKLTKDHEVVLIDEIERGDHEDKIRLWQLSRCRDHQIEMLHYCCECEKPVCKDCVIESHNSHQLQTIKEASEKRKQSVAKLKLDLEKEKAELNKESEKVEDQKIEELAKLEKYKKGIKNQAQKIIDNVKQRKKQLLAKLAEVEISNSDKIQSCIGRLQTQTKCIENCTQLSCQILEAENPYELLAINGQIQNTVQHLSDKTNELFERNKATLDELINIRYDIPDGKEETSVGVITEVSQDSAEPEEVINNAAAITPSLPKAAPRKNTATTQKRPKPPNRSTQLITAKELASLNEALDNAPTSKGQERHLSVAKDDNIHRSNSMGNIPRPTTFEMGNGAKGAPPRKPKAPRPPVSRPSAPPAPPPQHKKPSILKTTALPLRGILCTKFGKRGKVLTNGEFTGPTQHIVFSKTKFRVLALDADSKHILIFNGDGVFKKSFRVAASDQALKPVGMAEMGKLHVLVLFKKFITEWAWDGRLISKWGETELANANCIITDTQSRILVSDQEKHTVFIYDGSTKTKLTQIGGYGESETLFKSPRYITTNRFDNILVSDHHNHCIKVYEKNGAFLLKCGGKGSYDGELKYPEGIDTVTLSDGSEGMIVADEGNCRISLYAQDGRFLGHVLTKADDKNLQSPQTVSISHTGQEMAIRQANQVGIRIYKLSTVGS